MSPTQEVVELNRLNSMTPEALLAWAQSAHGTRAGIVTSFQNTGCVLIDMAGRVAPKLRVITIDPLRLHPETYEFMRTIQQRYGIEVERFTPDPERLRSMIEEHGEFLFFDSKPKQEYCCWVRKVEPSQRALATLDVWIAGLRKDQSESRKETARAAYVEQNGRMILKLNPLVDWTDTDVRAYLAEHQVPCNPLYDKGYTSIGCMVCTTPTLPGEDKRAGRWRWFNSTYADDRKECGIHIAGSGI
jgi:phosphoadenylyl-sulfate reductase (thioredoxin)